MKFILLTILLIFLLIPLAFADTTFFDQDDSFIMGSSEQEEQDTSQGTSTAESSESGGNSNFNYNKDSNDEPLNETSDSNEEDISTPKPILINWNYLLFLVITTLLVIVCIMIFKHKNKVNHLIKIILEKNNQKNNNSINGLIKKKVYSYGGNYIGEINEVVLDKNKIHSVKIKLDKKHRSEANGVILKYPHIKSVGDVVVIDDKVTELIRGEPKP